MRVTRVPRARCLRATTHQGSSSKKYVCGLRATTAHRARAWLLYKLQRRLWEWELIIVINV